MVTQEITDGQTAAPYEITGTESPSTLKKLVNPLEVGGEGHNAPKQISNALTLNDSIESNFYSGHISSQRQYAVKLLFTKEFERQKMLQKRLDPKMYKLYGSLDTMGSRMALLELQTSNSVEGKYAETFIEGITGQVKRVWGKLTNKDEGKLDA